MSSSSSSSSSLSLIVNIKINVLDQKKQQQRQLVDLQKQLLHHPLLQEIVKVNLITNQPHSKNEDDFSINSKTTAATTSSESVNDANAGEINNKNNLIQQQYTEDSLTTSATSATSNNNNNYSKQHTPPSGDPFLLHCTSIQLTPSPAAAAAPSSSSTLSGSKGDNNVRIDTGDDDDSIQNPPTTSSSLSSSLSSRYIAIFCPSILLSTVLEEQQQSSTTTTTTTTTTKPTGTNTISNRNDIDDDNDPIFQWLDSSVSYSLLSMIHPFLAQNFTIYGIVTMLRRQNHQTQQQQPQHHPADIILLDLIHCPSYYTATMIMEELFNPGNDNNNNNNNNNNNESIHSGPEAVLKVVVLEGIELKQEILINSIPPQKSLQQQPQIVEIPICPVCLYRIDPTRISCTTSLSPNHYYCSKYCTPPNIILPYQSSSSVVGVVDNTHSYNNHLLSCPRQRLLQPWSLPNYCTACNVIRTYWNNKYLYNNNHTITSTTSTNNIGCCNNDVTDSHYTNEVYCNLCTMQETLWVCLTCGFVGCGRYSNKHATEHNTQTLHPYCLELSTLRIWCYQNSEYIHRTDLLECPSSIQNLHHLSTLIYHDTTPSSNQHRRVSSPTTPIMTRTNLTSGVDAINNSSNSSRTYHTSQWNDSPYNADRYDEYKEYDALATTEQKIHRERQEYDEQMTMMMASTNSGGVDIDNNDDNDILSTKLPKKATMISEEYEVLLHSALEDQAQYYQGQITWLRATLTAQHVDRNTLTPKEILEIENLSQQIQQLRIDIECQSKELIQQQSLEAGYRATSQRLLRDQIQVQEEIKKVQQETMYEREYGQQQMEELELQIADLKANQRMMEQLHYLQHDSDDIQNSQIVTSVAATTTSGTTESSSSFKKASSSTKTSNGNTTSRNKNNRGVQKITKLFRK